MLDGLSTRYPDKTFYLGQVFNDTSNSYKFVWFLALLSLLRQRDDSALPLADLMTEMAATAWHPVCLFRLSLGRQDKLQEAILEIRKSSGLPLDAEPEEIRKFVSRSARDRRRLDAFRRYVPTRFLSPWCVDQLRGLRDSKKDSIIVRLARASQTSPLPTPYWFDADEIRLNPSWRHFLIENLGVVQAFAEYHFARYLQRRNPNVPGIVNKLSAPTGRDLQSNGVASKYLTFGVSASRSSPLVRGPWAGGELRQASLQIDPLAALRPGVRHPLEPSHWRAFVFIRG